MPAQQDLLVPLGDVRVFQYARIEQQRVRHVVVQPSQGAKGRLPEKLRALFGKHLQAHLLRHVPPHEVGVPAVQRGEERIAQGVEELRQGLEGAAPADSVEDGAVPIRLVAAELLKVLLVGKGRRHDVPELCADKARQVPRF